MPITKEMSPTAMRVLLASNSPRRRQLLSMLVPDFEIARMHDIDERYPSDLPAEQVPAYLSRLKAEAYGDQLAPGEVIITADTVVIDKDCILGKPSTPEEAVEMLLSLMGHRHHVVTGVTLTSTDKTDTFSETTAVTFGDITEVEIRDYVSNFHPLDKAGAYGIQEWIGGAGIVGVEGCFYNVMGLPLHALYTHLKAF